jgi:sulfur relay (sulfurtransferase) DsrF/TusC family protein
MASLRSEIRRFASASVLSAALAGPALAQQPAEKAQLTQALAEQKAANEVDTAIADAEKYAKVSTTKAVNILKAAQTSLDISVGIGSTKRDELTKKLEAKLAAYQPKDAGTRPNVDPKAAEVKKGVRQKYEDDLTEAKEVAEGLKKYADLKDAGRNDEARRTIAGLMVKYPRNPFLDAAGMQSYTAEQIRADANFTKRYADAMLKNSRDVIASATPATGDIQFMDAAEWRKLSEFRKKRDKLQLSEKEEGILKSLDTAVSVNFQDRPFEEALQDLSNKMNQEIFIDKQSLKDAGLDLTRGISFKGNVNARTALRAILQSNQLTFIVKGEMIQVVTLERAERELTTRSYYLGDLVMGTGPFGNAIQFGPVASYQQAVQNAENIVKAIKDSIDPRAWKDNGGACSVTFHMASLSVVVKASTEVHAMMGSSLSASPPKK